MTEGSTIHASAVLVGPKAVLIRGPSGSGKSHLAWQLILAADQGLLPFARLVADDRARIEAHGAALLVRPALPLAGVIEMRGLGLRQLPYEPVAMVGLVVDLAAADGARLPEPETGWAVLAGIKLPRLPVAKGLDPFPLLLGSISRGWPAIDLAPRPGLRPRPCRRAGNN